MNQLLELIGLSVVVLFLLAVLVIIIRIHTKSRQMEREQREQEEQERREREIQYLQGQIEWFQERLSSATDEEKQSLQEKITSFQNQFNQLITDVAKVEVPKERDLSHWGRLIRIGYFLIILAVIPTLIIKLVLRNAAEIVFQNLIKLLETADNLKLDTEVGPTIWLIVWIVIALFELLMVLKKRWGFIMVKPGTVATIELLQGYSWTAKHGDGLERINCFFYPIEKCRTIERDEFPEPPYLDEIQQNSYLLDLKIQEINIPAQPIITKDNAPATIDGFIYGLITDSQKAVYAVKHLRTLMVNLSMATLRIAGGDIELDDLIAEEGKEEIAKMVKETLTKTVSEFGFQVNEVRLKEVEPSEKVKEAMEKISIAERTKKATVTIADGEREATELKGKGKAGAISAMRKSFEEKEGNGSNNPSGPQSKTDTGSASRVITYEYVTETLPQMADGKATKILMPMELSGPASFVTGIVEAVKETKPAEPREEG